MKSRTEFGVFINAFHSTGLGAEIGVEKGEFSKVILKDWKGKLLLVDPWMHDDAYKSILNVPQYEQDSKYRYAQENLDKYADRTIFVRKTSKDAAMEVEDGSLDFVYIDARHAFEYALEDITLWYPKVRKGGIISGHDYLDGTQAEGYGENFGVKSAVDYFVSVFNKELHTTTDDEWDGKKYNSWWFIK